MTQPKVCAYCSKPAEGSYAIHRDGFELGPEVPLCNTCGDSPTPTCEEIWRRLGDVEVVLVEHGEVGEGERRIKMRRGDILSYLAAPNVISFSGLAEDEAWAYADELLRTGRLSFEGDPGMHIEQLGTLTSADLTLHEEADRG